MQDYIQEELYTKKITLGEAHITGRDAVIRHMNSGIYPNK